MASSPPFFFGSPPTRASNPLIQDAQFRNDNFVPILAIPEGEPSLPPSFTPACARNNGGGCVPVKFGIKPAAVRIEGFNCCSSRISAVAQVNHVEEMMKKQPKQTKIYSKMIFLERFETKTNSFQSCIYRVKERW